jgi:hypothetical protein
MNLPHRRQKGCGHVGETEICVRQCEQGDPVLRYGFAFRGDVPDVFVLRKRGPSACSGVCDPRHIIDLLR